MTSSATRFDGEKNKNKNTITMPLKVKDKQLFKNYNKTWKNLKD